MESRSTPEADIKAEEKSKDKTGKKKRKKEEETSPVENDKDKEKRTKTGRACDACVSLALPKMTQLTVSAQKRFGVIFWLQAKRKMERRNRFVLIASSTTWNVHSSSLLPRRGSRNGNRPVCIILWGESAVTDDSSRG
jgi:hypothetical protein